MSRRLLSGSLSLLALCLLLLGVAACGSNEECAADGDCVSLPQYGRGFTCEGEAGKRTCQRQCPTSCQADGDCGKCSGGKTYCVNGTCDYQPFQCPTSCSADNDCQSCENGQTSCVNGVCTQPPTVCPASCKVDTDCKDCADGNNSCLQGTCGQVPTCPATCQVDVDCLPCTDGKTKCGPTGVCEAPPSTVCPATCQQNEDCAPCPDGKIGCINGVCAEPQAQCPSACVRDIECSACASGLTSCIAGKCAAPPTCPNSCLTNADCAPCGADNQECVNGACGKMTCPTSCTVDGDCATCEAGKQSCVNGTCDAKPACPSSCTADADCGNCPTDQRDCLNGICAQKPVCPSSCNADSECSTCPTDQKDCVNGVCTKRPPACPASCAVNSDCAQCSGGKVVCTSGTCQVPTTCPFSCARDGECAACGGFYECRQSSCKIKQPPLAGPGQVCDTNNRCRNGDVCITSSDDNRSFCFEDCTSNNNLCAKNTTDGRTQCVPFATDQQGNTVSVCINVAKKGQPCSFGVAQQSRCQTGLNPPLYCSANNICRQTVVQTTAGAACNKQGDTTDPLKLCDRTKNLTCDQNTGKCIKFQFAKEGEKCDVNGTSGTMILCDPQEQDLSCISFNAARTISYCHKTCTPSASNQCAHKTGLKCEPLLPNNGGLCMDSTCTTNADCAFSTYECVTRTSGGNICYPPEPPGPKKFGEVCGQPSNTKGCTTGLFCLIEQGKTDGFCSKDCTTAGTTCPNAGTFSSSCQQINSNGTKACVIACSSTSTNCPTGLSCNTNFNLCLAP